MIKTKLLSVIMIALLSGCSTIHFQKGEQVPVQKTTEAWHHNFLFSLYEGSSVVNPTRSCANSQWSSVTTELTFANGFSGGLVNLLVGPLWYPKTVEVSCE